MFSIFTKSKNKTNLNWLGADIHSHLLPGLDDGSPDILLSLELINRLKLLGISDIYATPHIYMKYYPNTSNIINSSLLALQEKLDSNQTKVNIFAAAEYMVDSDFETIYQNEKLMLLPNNHILIEMPTGVESESIDNHLFKIQTMGYKPILAHPEYYFYCHSNMNRYRHYKNLGCLFQMNILSPTGYYGTHIKHVANKLLKEGMIDLVGTNIHNIKDIFAIERFVLSGNAYKAFKMNPIKNAELFTNHV